jgi:hypothetical protein
MRLNHWNYTPSGLKAHYIIKVCERELRHLLHYKKSFKSLDKEVLTREGEDFLILILAKIEKDMEMFDFVEKEFF